MKWLPNTILVLGILTAFGSCNGQNQKAAEAKAEVAATDGGGEEVSEKWKNIDCIFQNKNNDYWLGSNGEGVYHFDGKKFQHLTDSDGLCSNFVWSIQEDVKGYLWFSTRDGICRFDGKSFKNYTDTIKNAPYGALVYKPGGLFFNQPEGMCFYDGVSFTNFSLDPDRYAPKMNNMYRPYAVYCTWVDKTGKVWWGTQEKGVAVYDGKSFSFIDGKDLGGPAVRSVIQDKSGVMWFGNNGGGLFRYDGKTLRNITEEKNLGNYEFLKEKRPVDKPGSMARVFAINEDESENLWIGTVDAGIWKFNGTSLTNYTTKDGLTGNSVPLIYKTRKGELWFVSNGDAICRFDGQKFSKVQFQ